MLDGAGWHGARPHRAAQHQPIPLLPYVPELNPVERVWLHLRDRLLSHRLLDGYNAFVDACCEAWNT